METQQIALKTVARLQWVKPLQSVWDWFKADARHYQVLFQLIFLFYGIFILNWDIPLMRFNAVILTTLAVQALYIHFKSGDWSGLKSALISGLSICLMMQANSVATFILAAALSLLSKFFIRINGKHVFNPSNFGILVTILITGDSWVSPGQWGSDAMLLMVVGMAGLIVLYRVKRLDTALTFLITFLGLSFIRNVLYLEWPADFFIHQLNTGSLLLFSFFMITDPMAIPSSSRARMIWAAMVAFTAFMISWKMYVHTAPLWALFFLSPLVPVFDKIFPAEKFRWNQ
ncbi:MAG: hypothetical protein Fur0041_11350 [Bacteroidia bacterium]